jgi:4'-phosphopantetheinyl transferase
MTFSVHTPVKASGAMVCASNPGEVAVWWMGLGSPSAAVIAQWRVCLNAAEQAHADRFRFQEDRWTYIAAHWLIRTALASIGGLPPADWRFVVEKLGKPRIDPTLGRPELRFNLSHTRGFVACAVCVGSEIGIDVEALTRRRTGLDIAERFFSPSEVAILRGAPPDQQPDMFFRFWTLKEAFIKATGEGLSRALDSFSFSLDPISISFRPGGADEQTQWQFIEQRPTPRHFLALAVRRPATCPVTLTVCPMRPSA